MNKNIYAYKHIKYISIYISIYKFSFGESFIWLGVILLIYIYIYFYYLGSSCGVSTAAPLFLVSRRFVAAAGAYEEVQK